MGGESGEMKRGGWGDEKGERGDRESREMEAKHNMVQNVFAHTPPNYVECCELHKY